MISYHKDFLSYYGFIALMMELVYIRNLKFRARKGLGVRIPLRAFLKHQ